MILQTKIHRESDESTVSMLYIDGEFECFILEDGFNEPKIWGETRIPHGFYKIDPRYVGKFARRYTQRFGHDFSIHITDVPNFQYILMHIGNTILDTHGCLLTGTTMGYDKHSDDYVVRRSTEAYLKLFEKVHDPILAGDCWIAVDRSGSKYEKQDAISVNL